jgi:hypothetical protein
MPALSILQTTAALWGLPVHLPRVLRSPGAERSPIETARDVNARCHCAIPTFTWPGRNLGVRAPDDGETPLGAAEVWHGVQRGLIP